MSKIYRVREFANQVGKSPATIRRWDREGLIPSKRTPGGHRYYDESDVRKVLGLELPTEQKEVVVYCRVSSRTQQKDLQYQKELMQQFCLGAGLAVDTWIEEFGSGMNFRRPAFLNLVTQIEKGQIKQLVVAHKDRLVRFGFEFFAWFAERHGCEITVVNQERLSPEREMVEDLMTIIHCFSSRLYGLRRYKRKIREVAEQGAQGDSHCLQ